MLRAVLLLTILTASAAFSADTDPVYPVGKGVTSPRLLHKVDPEYSAEAERERVQGTALFTIVVDKSGKARDIELLSPLGFGLDEKGIAAIQKWTFHPGELNGQPVSVRAQIEVNFRFLAKSFDEGAESHRTDYNKAIHDIQSPDRQQRQKAVEKFRELSLKKFPPAMALIGEWMLAGTEIGKDIPGGIELIRKAAEEHDASGTMLLGLLYTEGKGVTADQVKGLKLIRDASTYGSVPAQLYLGIGYLNGQDSLPADTERARNYFRLCAARGNTSCEFQLGKLLMPVAGGAKGDAVQAFAWLELASEGANKNADPLLALLRTTLLGEDIQRSEKLKAQLIRH